MATNPYALPAGSRILVTGANGYIGSHVVDKLLGMGYRVRGSVRAPKPWLDEYFEQKYGQDVFERVLAGPLDDKNVLEQIMDGVDGVIHLVGTYPLLSLEIVSFLSIPGHRPEFPRGSQCCHPLGCQGFSEYPRNRCSEALHPAGCFGVFQRCHVQHASRPERSADRYL